MKKKMKEIYIPRRSDTMQIFKFDMLNTDRKDIQNWKVRY